MVGALACYSRDDNTVTYLKKHSKAGDSDLALPFEAASFSNPIGFIGSDEDHIYIADDGVNIDTVNENLRVNGNKNRIAAFNRKTQEITFSDTEATWYAEKSVYKFPETPVLLWEKDTNVPPTYHGVRYWVSTDGTSSAPTEATKIFQTTVSTNEITDIFCYDQEGNLYILWKESTVYCVTRFELKNGTYDFTQGQQLNLGISDEVVAIATDVSDGQKFLYCAAKKPSITYEIKQCQWDSTFTGAHSTAYNITLPSGKTVTALAANKDGVFVGVRELDSSQTKYTLKVGKYAKDTGAADGEGIDIVTDAPLQSVRHNTTDPYTSYNEAIHDLRIVDGTLYAVTSKLEQKMVYSISKHRLDEFRSSGILYKVGSTERFSGTAEELDKKEAVNPESGLGTGYGFYRFIAVKPKKLVIASDSAWGKGGTNPGPGEKQDTDTVLEYDLATHLASGPETAGGGFSKKLNKGLCEFEWN